MYFFLNNTLFYPLFLYSHYMTLLYKVFSFKTTHSVFTLQLEKVILIFQQEGIRYSQTIAGIYYALFFRSPLLKSRLMSACVALSVPRSTGWDWDCIIFWFDLRHIQFSSVQSLSRVRLSVTPWVAACQASLSITMSRSSLTLTSIESVMPSSHLILCRPLLLLPSILPSIRVFSNDSTLRMRWPKYWSISFSIIPSKEIPGLISFRMDWLDLLQNGLVGSPCSPRDSQESSPTPQFKSINSFALSLLHSPTLTSIHDHRKNHSLD